MSKTLLPGGLWSKFNLKEDGWNDEVNNNFALLDALIGNCVIDAVPTASLPNVGNEGDKYIDTDTKEIVSWYCNRWNRFPAPCNWVFKNVALGSNYYYDENGILQNQASGGGDNLGNHVATQDLDMGTNSIVNASNITANFGLIGQSVTLNGRAQINSNGGFIYGYSPQSANFSTSGHRYYGVDAFATPVTVTLSDADKGNPAALNGMLIMTFVDVNNTAGGNNITIMPQSGTFQDGSSAVVLNQDGASVTVATDGTDWFVITPMAPALASVGFEQVIEFTAPQQANSQQITSTTYVDCTSMPAVNVTFPEDGMYTFRYDGSVINRTNSGCDMGFRINIDNGNHIADLGLIELASFAGGESWERTNVADQIFVPAGTYPVKPQFNRPVGTGIPLLEGDRRHTLHITKAEANITNILVPQPVAPEWYGKTINFSTGSDTGISNNFGIWVDIGQMPNQNITVSEAGDYSFIINPTVRRNAPSGNGFPQVVEFGVVVDQVDAVTTGAVGAFGNFKLFDDQDMERTLMGIITLTAGAHTIRPVWRRITGSSNQAITMRGGSNIAMQIRRETP